MLINVTISFIHKSDKYNVLYQTSRHQGKYFFSQQNHFFYIMIYLTPAEKITGKPVLFCF